MIRSKVLIPALGVVVGVVAAFAPALAADAAAGAALYATKCRTCHGKDGEGNANMAKALKVEIKPLSSADVQKMSDGDLKKTVTDGTGKMKGIAGLSASDTDNLVAHIRSLKK
jgi:cytochrome c553